MNFIHGIELESRLVDSEVIVTDCVILSTEGD